MKFLFVNEFEIDLKTSKKLNILLKKCFPDTEFKDRDYFKQLPHYRILAMEGDHLIGQIAIDFRVMNLNNEALKIFGVIDLCVDPEFRGKEIGKKLMLEFESIAKKNPERIDFLFLVTDRPEYYQEIGYEITTIKTTWLKIDQHINYGIGTEKITDATFMIKPNSDKVWSDGKLDLLGYMY